MEYTREWRLNQVSARDVKRITDPRRSQEALPGPLSLYRGKGRQDTKQTDKSKPRTYSKLNEPSHNVPWSERVPRRRLRRRGEGRRDSNERAMKERSLDGGVSAAQI